MKQPRMRPSQAVKLLADLSSVLCVLIGWIWGWIYRSTGVDSVKLIGESNSAGLYFQVPSLNEETVNLLAGASKRIEFHVESS